MEPKLLLFAALGLFAAVYIIQWVRTAMALRAAGATGEDQVGFPTPVQLFIGAVTDFFDTLGIGSFAPTTAMFRAFKVLPDERIPGTLNVGHTLPTIAQAFIFIALVQVDFLTMSLLIVASVLGSYVGAGIVSGWDRTKIRIGMGVALLIAAALFAMANFGIGPAPGTALKLEGTMLYAGVIGNFLLGALMPLGIGLYGPCLIMISLLGMDPRAAFPIMMGSCAFLMPVASIRFMKEKAYSVKPALGLAIAGIPAVLVAAYIVKSLPLQYIRGLVVVVVLYTAVTMLRSARYSEQ